MGLLEVNGMVPGDEWIVGFSMIWRPTLKRFRFQERYKVDEQEELMHPRSWLRISSLSGWVIYSLLHHLCYSVRARNP